MFSQLDFLHGLPVSASEDLQHEPEVTPANRIRLIHSYVTNDLGVVPLSTEWSRVRDMLAVHDSEFDARWVKSLTRGVGATVHIDKLKDHVRPFFLIYSYADTTCSVWRRSCNVLCVPIGLYKIPHIYRSRWRVLLLRNHIFSVLFHHTVTMGHFLRGILERVPTQNFNPMAYEGRTSG